MNGIIMKSIHFEFLREKWPELASLAGFSEAYAWPDPASALVKLRAYAEAMIHRLYEQRGIAEPFQASLYDLLEADQLKRSIPRAILNAFHAIRLVGNKAAHGESILRFNVSGLLKDAFDLGSWFYLTYGGSREDIAPYAPPKKPSLTPEAIEEQRHLLQKQLAANERDMESLLAELDAARSRTLAAEKRVDELEAILDAGQAAADVLGFDEATTRKRLIDTELTVAGWDVGVSGANTAQVRQEEPIDHQPTATGKGYGDYVLWDDNGLPLAVIEAKKTAKSAQLGREQARLYADGLEKMYGQRPIIFYTNGFDIFLWDDAQGYPPRQVFGFYSKDSLQYLVYQRKNSAPLNTLAPRIDIVDRLYQVEAIKRVAEAFSSKHRKALIVQATGTGKTRVAIALTELLYRARWIIRVLFLCDRKELRKQAKNAYNDYLDEPMTIVSAHTARDRNQRIYLATYPAMNKIYQTFDVGFFDLIIADESHRSIYNRYRDMFRYFDALQVGLTATPVDFISRNTFRIFQCEEKNPTAYYSLDQAVEEGYLVPYEVFSHTTQFLRSGIKYRDLTEEQKRQLEEDGEEPETFDYENHQIDRQIFNRDTNRAILRNLMENGIMDETGQAPGKTIVFARNHNHAVLLSEIFDELYPQYGGRFCRVIDNYDPRAEQLIDDFKSHKNSDPRIAISVDMLDTGIDVPETVNLVFAKPILSLVKIEQMIGRGTRLCPNLFGPGKNKTHFRIFDHWGNFEYFDKQYKQADPSASRSLMQQLFETRLGLARTALNQGKPEIFNRVIALIREDLERLSEDTISVREKWREKRELSRPETLHAFAPATEQALRHEMAPLMKWVDIRSHTEAYRFDLLIATLQSEVLKKSGRFADVKDQMLDQISRIPMHLNPVREKVETINAVRGADFWQTVSAESLETVRRELRGIMRYAIKPDYDADPPKHIDVVDGGIEYKRLLTRLKFSDMPGFRKRVQEVLLNLFHENPTLQKIKAGSAVSDADLKALVSLILTQHPTVDQEILREFFEAAAPLDHAIRSIIGMDAEAVNERFARFVATHPGLSATQVSFLNLLKNHISRYGSIEVEALYEHPFTTLHSDGLDGVFTDEHLTEELLAVIATFQSEAAQGKGDTHDQH
jgi:type I restriction enzyme, R subunit